MLKTANSATSAHDILGYLFDMFFGEGFVDPEIYRRSVENIFQVPYFYYSQVGQRGAPPINNAEPLSFEAITWCYRVFLLREPEGRFLLSAEFSATQIRHLQQAFPNAKRILLIHIPKTAGTSLREWAFERVPNGICVHDVKDTKRRFPSDFENAKQRLVISGHQPWGNWLISPQDKVFSLLREPLARAVSFYRYIGKLARVPDPREVAFFEHLLGLSFNQVATGACLPPSEQCRYLSNEGTFRAVIANSKAFDLSLSTVENISVLARKLAAALGVDYTELPRLNNTDGIELPVYNLDELAEFHDINKEDFLLYAYVSAIEGRSAGTTQLGMASDRIRSGTGQRGG